MIGDDGSESKNGYLKTGTPVCRRTAGVLPA